jgi:hypothetical protein
VYARCPDCRDRFPVLAASGARTVLDCSSCGKRHRVQIPDAAILTRLERESDLMPAEDAVSVVLGLLTLEQALSRPAPRRAAVRVESRQADRREASRIKAVLGIQAALSVVAALVVFRAAGRASDGEAGPLVRPALPSGTELLHDDDGKLVWIRSATPERVLTAYCAAGPVACEPHELAYGARPEAGLRFGVVRRDAAPPLAIEIRRRVGVHDWVAGDGTDIPLRPAPPRAGVAIPIGRRNR